MKLMFRLVISGKIGMLRAQLRTVEDDLVKAIAGNFIAL